MSRQVYDDDLKLWLLECQETATGNRAYVIKADFKSSNAIAMMILDSETGLWGINTAGGASLTVKCIVGLFERVTREI